MHTMKETVLDQLDIHTEKKKSFHLPHTIYKNQLQMDHISKCKGQNTKFSEENSISG